VLVELAEMELPLHALKGNVKSSFLPDTKQVDLMIIKANCSCNRVAAP
jgi:hypothetical protein